MFLGISLLSDAPVIQESLLAIPEFICKVDIEISKRDELVFETLGRQINLIVTYPCTPAAEKWQRV